MKVMSCIVICCMEIHPEAPENPYYHLLNEMIHFERQVPRDYRRQSKARTIHVA